MLKWRAYTRTVDAPAKSDAMKLLPAFVAEAMAGEIDRQRQLAAARSAQPTLADWSDRFLKFHVSQDPDRAATRVAYEKAFRHYLLPPLGGLRLHEITAAKIREAFVNQYRAGRSPRTLRLAHSVLHLAMEAAIEDGLIEANPTPKMSKLRLGEPVTPAAIAKKRALSREEVAALLAGSNDPQLALWTAIMASTGLRPGEAAGLRWQDVDGSVLHVRSAAKSVYMGPGQGRLTWLGTPKTRSSVRDIGIGPTLVAMLAAERERQERYQRQLRGRDPAATDFQMVITADCCVLPGDPDTPEGLRVPVNPDLLRARFRHLAEKVGVKASPHSLRHTAISHAIDAGVSLADAAARAGHSTPQITASVYLHSVNESQRRAAAIGDTLLAPAEQPRNVEAANDGHK